MGDVPIFGSNGPLWSLANEFWYYVLFSLAAFDIGNNWRGNSFSWGHVITYSFRLLFLGQINLHKGIVRLLEAMRLLKDEPVELILRGPAGSIPRQGAICRKSGGSSRCRAVA